MFTGIISNLCSVTSASLLSGKMVLRVKAQLTRPEVNDSIAINGCCLTIVKVTELQGGEAELEFDVLPESLRKTTLGSLKVGDLVHAEEALLAGSKMGGHSLQGHVDCMANISHINPQGESTLFTFLLPESYGQMIVPKGFIGVDGISLTVVDCTFNSFTVMTIPHTRTVTNAKNWTLGTEVNIEVDIINKSIFHYINQLQLIH